MDGEDRTNSLYLVGLLPGAPIVDPSSIIPSVTSTINAPTAKPVAKACRHCGPAYSVSAGAPSHRQSRSSLVIVLVSRAASKSYLSGTCTEYRTAPILSIGYQPVYAKGFGTRAEASATVTTCQPAGRSAKHHARSRGRRMVAPAQKPTRYSAPKSDLGPNSPKLDRPLGSQVAMAKATTCMIELLGSGVSPFKVLRPAAA